MKRLKKIALYTLAVLTVGISILVLMSPFKHHSNEFRTVEATITISAPIDSVFEYMGHSEFASDWSAYVHHITPLNTEKHPDGELWSKRKIFIDEDEKGARWEEKIIKISKNKNRTLSIYNINEMSLSADGLQTEQRYKKLNAKESSLSLVLYFNAQNNSYWNQFWMHIASFRTRNIFKKNLENIKREIELRQKK